MATLLVMAMAGVSLPKPDNVPLRLVLLSLTEGGNKRIGVSWGPPTAPPVWESEKRILQSIRDGQLVLGPDIDDPETVSWSVRPFARSPFVIAATVNMLLKTGEARVYASDELLTSGYERFVEVPAVTWRGDQVAMVPVGIKLEIGTSESDGDFILVNLVGYAQEVTPPYIVRRNIRTQLRIKPGDTIRLGVPLSQEAIEYARIRVPQFEFADLTSREYLVLLITVDSGPFVAQIQRRREVQTGLK